MRSTYSVDKVLKGSILYNTTDSSVYIECFRRRHVGCLSDNLIRRQAHKRNKSSRGHSERNMTIMNDPNSKLLVELNSLMAAFKNDTLLSKLPSGSWQASFVITGETLTVEILRNDDLLMKKFWDRMTDPTSWLVMFVPPTSILLARNKSILPPNMKVIFNAKSETEEWRASCSASELIEAALNGEIDQFGSMMAMLDHDLVKNE